LPRNRGTNSDLQSITDLNPKLLDEIEHFFISYNEVKGKKVQAARALRAGARVEAGAAFETEEKAIVALL
jgi:inorganic pyrophosphatase